MIVAAVLTFLFLGIGAAEPVGAWARRDRSWLATAAACGVIAAAGLPLALHWVDAAWLLALLALAAAALAASIVARRASSGLVPKFAPNIDRNLPFALFAPPALLTLAGWLEDGGSTASVRLSAAPTFAGFLLFTVAFGPIRSCFRQIGRLEEAESAADPRPSRSEPNPYLDAQAVLRRRAFMFTFAALVAALLLLVRVARALGAEDLTSGSPEGWPLVLAGGLAATSLTAVGAAVSSRRRGEASIASDRRDRLHLHWLSGITVVAAVGVWPAACIIAMSESDLHYPLAACAAGAFVGVLMAESILWNASLIPMIPVGLGRAALAAAVGLGGGVAASWLIGVGLWSGGQPVGTETAIWMTLIVCAPTAAVTCGVAVAVWWSTRSRHKHFHHLEQTVPQDVVLDLLLFVIALAVPAAVVARLDALDIGGRGLAGLAPLVAATGVLAAVYFFLETNWLVPTRERPREPPDELAFLADDACALEDLTARSLSPFDFRQFTECQCEARPDVTELAARGELLSWLNARRVCLLRLRVVSNNAVPIVMLAFGLVWLAARLT